MYQISIPKLVHQNCNYYIMERFTDDTVVALASFLSPHDMLSLALTCKKFGDKNGADNKKRSAAREEDTREVRQRTDSISLMEVAAHTVIFALATEDERNALPRRGEESWIGIYQEFIVVFHTPLQFDKLAGDSISHVDNNDKTKVCSSPREVYDCGIAICSNIMRAGKHCVSFQFNLSYRLSLAISCGIMRPTTNDITTLRKCHPVCDDLSSFSLKDYESLYNDNNIDCCLMDTSMGHGSIRKRWKMWKESELLAMYEDQREKVLEQNEFQSFDWGGIEHNNEASYKIGMVLDLDEGTLDVYKNDRRLGTMIRGLVGEYCWVVSFRSLSGDISVSIGR